MINARPSPIWWIYFGVVAAWGLLGIQIFFKAAGVSLISVASMIIDFICLIGLFGYIRGYPLLSASLWGGVLGLFVGKLSLSAILMFVAYQRQGANMTMVALDLLGYGLAVPMMIALWRYAFQSPSVWRPGPSSVGPA